MGDDKPVVAWIEKTWDGKFSLSQASYQSLLVEYAGGTMIDAEAVKLAMGSKMDASYQTTDSSAFFEALKEVDAVVDLTYAYDVPAYDFDAFLTGFGLEASSDLAFIQNQKVFRVDAQISGASNLDWFESRLAHPDFAVEGLVRVLKSDSQRQKKYFRNIAIGEHADGLNMDDCKMPLVACEESTFHAPLTMIDCSQLPIDIPACQVSSATKRKRKQQSGKNGNSKQTTSKSRKSRKSVKRRNSKRRKSGKKSRTKRHKA